MATNLVIQTLFSLNSKYNKKPTLSAVEFIEEIKQERTLLISEENTFLHLAKHQKFLKDLTEYFIDRYRLRTRTCHNNVEVVIYLLIFLLNEETFDIILDCCIRINTFYLCDIAVSLLNKDVRLYICKVAGQYFEDQYVLENIVDPIVSKMQLFAALGKSFIEFFEIKPLPLTKPKEFNIVQGNRFITPFPPCNTPAVKDSFRSVKPPQSTWKKDKSIEKNILKSKKQNREKAQELLLEASKVPLRLLAEKITNAVKVEEKKERLFTIKPPPAVKSVKIKENLTTTLRQAARVAGNQEKEARKIEEIIKGGCSQEGTEKIEEELRKEREINELETIERNHLKGLLSYEEAILAKKRIFETNKEKMEKFKEEKFELEKILEQWRNEEEQKIKALVGKTQAIKFKVKESQTKVIKMKQESVRMQQYETKLMLDQVLKEKDKELKRKIELIKEIKLIHQVRCNIKEFDPTETPNLGLLCEMSIAELQERLVLAKMQMNKELEEKRQHILKKKEDHMKMIENVKKFIAESRSIRPKESKPKPLDHRASIKENPEILKLRRQLEEKRKLRNS